MNWFAAAFWLIGGLIWAVNYAILDGKWKVAPAATSAGVAIFYLGGDPVAVAVGIAAFAAATMFIFPPPILFLEERLSRRHQPPVWFEEWYTEVEERQRLYRRSLDELDE